MKKKLLDLGCGSALCHKNYPDFDITGIDINPEFIAKAKQNNGGHYFVDDICGDLSKLHGRKFDKVLALEVLEHAHNPRRLIENMLYFVNSDGVCVLTTPNALGYEFGYRFRDKKKINSSVNQYLTPSVIKGLINRLSGRVISQNFGSRVWLKHIRLEFKTIRATDKPKKKEVI